MCDKQVSQEGKRSNINKWQLVMEEKSHMWKKYKFKEQQFCCY